MKFGSQLRDALYPEWRFYYLDYAGLKRQIKDRTVARSYKEGDEAYFVEQLEQELDKVFSFQQVKYGEINRRVQALEDRVQKLSEDPETEMSAYEDVEVDINAVLEEVNELARFTRLNYSGFLKIIKKHDKHTGYVLKPMFMVRLNARPFYRESFDAMMLQLSRLYDIVRNGGKDAGANAAATGQGGAQNFVRRTTKYWVHPDNVLELKFYILKYLPVLIFQSAGGNSAGGKSDLSAPDPAITSIYFDNADLDLYQGRLEKTEGAEAIRLRWYGPTTNQEIFVERKTHCEDWTGETSVKQRFPIKEKHVNAFVRGEYTLDKTVAKLRAAGTRSAAEIDALEVLAQEVQTSIREKKLAPTMRSFYNRTAFQLPGSAAVRISLDTELTLVREDSLDGSSARAGSNWRRTDIGTDYPFSQLPDGDVCRFPYAILEVKLQTQMGTEPPEWVTNLVQSHMVEEVPKFSKFIHGCATLLEPHVQLLPFWLPQMDKDIRKKPMLTHPAASIATRPTPLLGGNNSNGHRRTRSRASSVTSSRSQRSQHATGLTGRLSAVLGKVLGRGTGGPRRRRRSITQRAAVSRSSKRVAVPVRVEPKVFFANERTFLSWVHFAIVLGSLALGLLNFGDDVGRTAGVLFTVIAMGILVYALYLYIWRSNRIRAREAGPYDDRVGPAVLVGVILTAVAINFYLRFSALNNKEPDPSKP
ncbi:SPX-domain-containing protein [Thamnocephalis sphaerospora]|uniref:Vacuolar transporter chaperone complex subunit 4 n=1 Tax=Thamnocephalis sphaerospora TaxID=78915 RepID=A0A4P9XVM4_9FUNG|nr:SPX-domain-containing protein [Thamnocephalis sphaerospora]|eukprot:RKP09460.1 SPX-domain-containing protein [Thamnocephalis sphaerospora]